MVAPDEWQVALRVILAALFGGVIGWNRQRAGKPAGLRTHMLVSLGSALFVLAPMLAGESHAGDTLGRTIQGVAAGVGFLGAGEIMHQIRWKPGTAAVHGLTSAAAIWVTAGIGVAAGCGLWKLALLAAAISVGILSGAQRLERLFPGLDQKTEKPANSR